MCAADDLLVFLREHAAETALVHVARAARDPVRIESRHLPGIDTGHTEYGPSPDVTRDTVTLVAAGPQVSVHVWSRKVRRARPTRAR